MITYYGKWPDVVQAAGEVGMEITDELELTRHYVSVEDVLAQVRSRDWIRPDRLITIYSEYGGKPLWSGY